mmetsp:Transcript_21952/g.60092  ORF Transcript_21952/g.60092 Transcript_21952/m.60092 type:complete len:94 (+) Transcript_21952:905-1186(+)
MTTCGVLRSVRTVLNASPEEAMQPSSCGKGILPTPSLEYTCLAVLVDGVLDGGCLLFKPSACVSFDHAVGLQPSQWTPAAAFSNLRSLCVAQT